MLFVPSLINRAYVLDLLPERSMLRWLATRGIRPLLLDWGWPGPLERQFGLSELITGRLERALGTTAWQKDTTHPWGAADDTIAVWVRGEDAALPVARFTAGAAEVIITLERTGAPTSSERLLGKEAETFYVNVAITDMSRFEAYQARVLRARRARGSGTTPLWLSAFMADTTPP